VIGVPDELKGQTLVCFCVLKPGIQGEEPLREALRQGVIGALGKSMAPGRVVFVRDLPKTRNMKIMRRVVRTAWLGQDPGDISSLENPAAIEDIRSAR
jgi:acetyl-CoA synthetase